MIITTKPRSHQTSMLTNFDQKVKSSHERGALLAKSGAREGSPILYGRCFQKEENIKIALFPLGVEGGLVYF